MQPAEPTELEVEVSTARLAAWTGSEESHAGELWELPAAGVHQALGSRPEGLSAAEVEQRRRRDGANLLPRPPPPPWWRRLIGHFGHVMAVLLWVGGIVAFLGGLPELGIAIWTVNIVNGCFSYWQEHKAERAAEALQRLLPSTVTVVRDGHIARVDAAEVVRGDVMLVEEGDRICADGRLVEDAGLRVDQSTLTGESAPVRKSSDPVRAARGAPTDLPDLVFAGTTVATGRGRAVVSATGARTEFGRVAALTQSMAIAESPLQQEMRRVSVTVSIVAVGAGIAFFALAIAAAGMSLAGGFVLTLGMIVAFVPEGLLPTVTLTLAMATQRMARREALVRRLSAVEALGCATVICTDKTGTLTQNEMTVTAVWTPEQAYTLGGIGYRLSGDVSPAADERLREVLRSAALCSNARLVDAPDGGWSVVGDPTEGALMVAARKIGVEPERAAEDAPRLVEYAFDSRRKRMSIVVAGRDGLRLLVKGAPLELLSRCDRQRVGDGIVPLDDADRRTVVSAVEELARNGLRVLGVAARDLQAVPEGVDPDPVERSLSLLGLVAMQDPPRPEVAEAVVTCRRAGIRVVMVTGDHGATAESIARRVGIVGEEPPLIVSGEQLDGMDDGRLAEVLTGTVIFCRVSPDHKMRVVEGLQGLGEVVAVTGDGVNDAPALKRADIGVAMGRSGTDVAKEAADVVLLDDNFASIVAAVEEGRAVYDNIKKFTTYILTSNTPEAVPFVVSALSGGVVPVALGVMHVLAVDLGTDLAPALALGAERPEPGVMDRPPRRPEARLIDRRLLVRAYLWLGPAQALFVMAAFLLGYRLQGWPGWGDLPASGPVFRAAAAMALAAVVATQIGNLFAQRSATLPLSRVGLGGNRALWWGIASEVVVLAAIVFLPGLGRVIGTAPFPAIGWAWLLLGIPLLPIVDGIHKVLVRRKEERRPT